MASRGTGGSLGLKPTGAIPYAMGGRGVRFRRAQLMAWVDRGGGRNAQDTTRRKARGRRPSGQNGAPDVRGVLEDPRPQQA